MIRLEDIYWAAGFLEGEGSFSSSGRHYSRIEASQVDKESLEKIQKIFWGRIYLRQNGKKFQNSKRSPYWVWYLGVRKSIEVMLTLYVLMSNKRKGQIFRTVNLWRKRYLNRGELFGSR